MTRIGWIFSERRPAYCIRAFVRTRNLFVPEKETIERARQDEREGKSPSTQAGEFVREEMEHIRQGEHGARSAKQAIAIGLSKARRAGVKLPPPKKGTTSERVREQAGRELKKGASRNKPSPARSRAARRRLEREPRSARVPSRAFTAGPRSCQETQPSRSFTCREESGPNTEENLLNHGQRKTTRRRAQKYQESSSRGQVEKDDRGSPEEDPHRSRKTGSESRETKTHPFSSALKPLGGRCEQTPLSAHSRGVSCVRLGNE